MPDNLNITAPKDRKHVNPSQPWEITYWCDKFDCTKDELKTAVAKVGNQTKDVEGYFNRR